MEVRRHVSHGFERQTRRALQRCGWTAPADGEIKVLVFDTGTAVGWAAAAARMLGPDEQERAARFRFAEHCERYVLSHGIWRVALGLCMPGGTFAVRLEPTSRGQPRLPGSEFATSLSHSGSWAAVAVARTASGVGVDIESSASLERMDELASFMCAPGEEAWLRALAGRERRQAMLRLWTRKEAILKARGEGLSQPPSLLDATGDRHDAAQDQAACGSVLRVRDLAGLPDGLTGALAAPAELTAIRLHLLDASAWRTIPAAGGQGLQEHKQGAAAWDVVDEVALSGVCR